MNSDNSKGILAIETSSGAASAAFLRGGVIAAYAYQNIGLTHSRTLLPMIRDMLRNAGLTIADVGRIAAAVGPGSFTGIRIGASAAKGIAFATGIPCAGISTLEALAVSLLPVKGLICCALDARRGEVYSAMFYSDGKSMARLTADGAFPAREIVIPEGYPGAVYCAGDGAELAYKALSECGRDAVLLPPDMRCQNAKGVALTAALLPDSAWGGLEKLNPCYLRRSQAERERLEKAGGTDPHIMK